MSALVDDTSRPWHIYALTDPRTGEARYIGWATIPAKRYREHVNLAKRSENPRAYSTRWIQTLLADGVEPALTILETGEGEGWGEAEQRWIAKFRAEGARLTNMTDGGEGMRGYRFSEESRAKMSAAKTGRRLTPEHIEASHAPLRGRRHTPEAIQRMAEARAQSTYVVPEELRQRFREMYTGRKHSPEAIAKIAAASRGHSVSDKQRRKISEANKGRKPATHTVEASVAARTGVPLSAEHKTRISESVKGRPQKCGSCGESGHKRSTCSAQEASA